MRCTRPREVSLCNSRLAHQQNCQPWVYESGVGEGKSGGRSEYMRLGFRLSGVALSTLALSSATSPSVPQPLQTAASRPACILTSATAFCIFTHVNLHDFPKRCLVGAFYQVEHTINVCQHGGGTKTFEPLVYHHIGDLIFRNKGKAFKNKSLKRLTKLKTGWLWWADLWLYPYSYVEVLTSSASECVRIWR